MFSVIIMLEVEKNAQKSRTLARLEKELSNMPVSKKQQASVNKYIKENYDTYRLTFPKGKKEELKTHAATTGESLNGFVNRAIDETMERDNMKGEA